MKTWYPAALNVKREPYRAENTFYQSNQTKIFDSDNCIFGNGGKYGVVAINGAYPSKPIEVTEVRKILYLTSSDIVIENHILSPVLNLICKDILFL